LLLRRLQRTFLVFGLPFVGSLCDELTLLA
jgi:hypothetical protein